MLMILAKWKKRVLATTSFCCCLLVQVPRGPLFSCKAQRKAGLLTCPLFGFTPSRPWCSWLGASIAASGLRGETKRWRGLTAAGTAQDSHLIPFSSSLLRGRTSCYFFCKDTTLFLISTHECGKINRWPQGKIQEKVPHFTARYLSPIKFQNHEPYVFP